MACDGGDVVIDAAVFDFGNVLIGWDRRWLYERLIPDPDRLAHFLDEILTLDANEALDRGEALQSVVDRLSARHPDHRELLQAFNDRWIETLGAVSDETVRVVDELIARSVPVFGLTNWGAETYELARPRLTFLSRLSGVVVSGHEGVVKPDPAIFGILCDRYGIVPERSVFVDDSAANVAAAAELGFAAVRFTDAARLRADLVTLGVLV